MSLQMLSRWWLNKEARVPPVSREPRPPAPLYLDGECHQDLPLGLWGHWVILLGAHALRLQDVACPPIERKQRMVHLHVLV